MKSIAILAAFLAVLNANSPCQEPVPVASRRPLAPGNIPSAAGVADDLSRNYRLTIGLRQGDKPVREIVVLTASAQVRVSAVLEQDEATQGSTSVELNGVLSEKEDRSLRFSYQVGASVPRISQTLTSRSSPADGPKNVATSISYANESATGVLVMEPGKPYEIFKSAQRSYTLTIEPETPGKGK